VVGTVTVLGPGLLSRLFSLLLVAAPPLLPRPGLPLPRGLGLRDPRSEVLKVVPVLVVVDRDDLLQNPKVLLVEDRLDLVLLDLLTVGLDQLLEDGGLDLKVVILLLELSVVGLNPLNLLDLVIQLLLDHSLSFEKLADQGLVGLLGYGQHPLFRLVGIVILVVLHVKQPHLRPIHTMDQASVLLLLELQHLLEPN